MRYHLIPNRMVTLRIKYADRATADQDVGKWGPCALWGGEQNSVAAVEIEKQGNHVTQQARV